jgi:hypothetical protein
MAAKMASELRVKFGVTEPNKVEWSHLRIRQPVNGDAIIEVRYEPDGPDVTYCDVRHESHGPDVSYRGLTLYLAGLDNEAPLAAVAFCTSHLGAYNDEPSHIAAERWEKMVAVVTKMVEMTGHRRREGRCLTDILKGAFQCAHSPMTFDKKDLATRLRRIASGHAQEFVSYTALCTS